MSLRWKYALLYVAVLLLILAVLYTVSLSLFEDDGLALRWTAWPVA